MNLGNQTRLLFCAKLFNHLARNIIQNTYFKSNLLTKIVYDYNILDSLDRDRFIYSAVFIRYIKACGEKSYTHSENHVHRLSLVTE